MKSETPSQIANELHVFVTVAGGFAYVASAPESVKVHIIDYDDLKADFDQTFAQFSPRARRILRTIHNAHGKARPEAHESGIGWLPSPRVRNHCQRVRGR